MYVFEKNRKKVECCPCGKNNKSGKFAPFVGHENFGYCHSCNKLYKPENGTIVNPLDFKEAKKLVPISYIDNKIFEKSLSHKEKNNFYRFLANRFGVDKSNTAFNLYKIGTSNRWSGATIFWQIDQRNKVHSGRVMLYDSIKGKRIKTCNDWVHSILKRKKLIPNFNLEQCLFGLHLITNKKPQQNDCCDGNIVAIVESEKTACIMSIVSPCYTWMACGGLSSLNSNKMKPLKGNRIILFPDLDINSAKSPYSIWIKKAFEFRKLGLDVHVSDLLEKRANEEQRKNKWDIADFFIVEKPQKN